MINLGKNYNIFINVKILFIFYLLISIINLISVINYPTYFGWFTVGLVVGIMFTIPYQSIINSQRKLMDNVNPIMDWKKYNLKKKHKEKKK